MRMRNLYLCLCLILFALSCRKDVGPIPEEQEQILVPQPDASPSGLYLLNEANMNSNKASLDFLNFKTGVYRRNIYNQANPSVTKGLGDVGNDLLIYGSKMYVVLNTSNKVEVLDMHSGKKLGQINIANCRYLCQYNGKIYVSAYLGAVADASTPNGIVAEVDTSNFSITRRVNTGRQPEQLAVINGKLYVANSGGYSPPDYERTVSVIDINSFRELKRIDVGINLHRLKADQYGDLYVSSRGDYYNIPSRLYVIDTQKDEVKKSFDLAVSDLCIAEDLAYIYSTEWNATLQKNSISYNILDVKNETLLNRPFITDGTQEKIKIPYGIAVNPQSGDIYVTDAKNYVVPGRLYCYSSTGQLKWDVETGDIPAHFAFVY